MSSSAIYLAKVSQKLCLQGTVLLLPLMIEVEPSPLKCLFFKIWNCNILVVLQSFVEGSHYIGGDFRKPIILLLGKLNVLPLGVLEIV